MTQSFEQILARLHAGDPAAMRAYYEATSACTLGVILNILGEHEPSVEILKDLYLEVWLEREDWKVRNGPSQVDLCRLAHQKALGYGYRTRSALSSDGRREDAS